MSILSKFASNPSDSDTLRLEKVAAILVSGSCSIAGIVWALMYYMVFGLTLTSLLPLAFTVIVVTAIAISHYTKNHYWAVYAQIICIIYITAFIQWSIGGVFHSGFVMAWAFCGPVTALTFFSIRQSAIWFLLYLLNIFVTVYFNDYFSLHALPVNDSTKLMFFVMNLGVSSVVVFIFASFFVSNTMKERERANGLLLNILPTDIAKTLKNSAGSIARRHEEVCVLFADIVGFTEYSSNVSPEELVSKLDAIFKQFDALAHKYNLEKIKTIGDAYMVAGGIPHAAENCAERMGDMAIAMHRAVEMIPRDANSHFKIRIGMHCGAVVAGVIGHSKFAYDLWGDTVNIASRLESSCEEGKIQVSETLASVLSDKFVLQRRGETNIRGKGLMSTYYVVSRKNNGNSPF